MAVASEFVSAEVVDAEEFMGMATKYKVGGIPKTLLNYQSEFVGVAPDSYVVEKILSAPPMSTEGDK